MNGKNLLIYIDGHVLAMAKDCRVEMNVEADEVDSPTAGYNRVYRPGMKDWQVSASTLVTTVYSSLITHGRMVRLTFVVRENGSLTADRMTGSAIITKADVTGSRGSLSTGSFVFKGSGSLTQQSGVL